MDSPLLTTKEAADYLKVSERTLRNQRSAGTKDEGLPLIPYRKAGRFVRYHIDDLNRVFESVSGEDE